MTGEFVAEGKFSPSELFRCKNLLTTKRLDTLDVLQHIEDEGGHVNILIEEDNKRKGKKRMVSIYN